MNFLVVLLYFESNEIRLLQERIRGGLKDKSPQLILGIYVMTVHNICHGKRETSSW